MGNETSLLPQACVIQQAHLVCGEGMDAGGRAAHRKPKPAVPLSSAALSARLAPGEHMSSFLAKVNRPVRTDGGLQLRPRRADSVQEYDSINPQSPHRTAEGNNQNLRSYLEAQRSY